MRRWWRRHFHARLEPTSSHGVAVGLWKGTITSTGSGQTQQAVGTVTDDGQFHLMTANGVNYVGQMAASPANFSMTMSGYVPVGQTFPNGAQNGSMSFSGTVTSSGMMSGTYSGAGESGTFSMTIDPMGTRSASMQMVAGTYTRSNSSGYTVTMTVDSNGQMTGSDTQGCVFNGTVSSAVPCAQLLWHEHDRHVVRRLEWQLQRHGHARRCRRDDELDDRDDVLDDDGWDDGRDERRSERNEQSVHVLDGERPDGDHGLHRQIAPVSQGPR